MIMLSASALVMLCTHAAASPVPGRSPSAAPGAPHTLLAEYWPSPAVGVDIPRPRFSWTLGDAAAGGRAVTSAAHQVVVAEAGPAAAAANATAAEAPPVWDSGKVADSASNQVACGVALKADTRYTWKVSKSMGDTVVC
eukprot:SAG22_NODE_309_length_12657_cov_34.643733_7_plen_139_part_00